MLYFQPMSSNQSNQSDPRLTILGLWVGYFELVCFILGSSLNIFVICMSARLCTKYRYRNQMLVISMLSADFLMCCVHSPLLFMQYALGIHHGRFVCNLMYTVTFISTISSSLSLLSLNVDKFYHLYKPLHYDSIVTPRKLGAAVFSCWTISVCGTMVFLHGPGQKLAKNECGFDAEAIGVYVIFTCCFFILPNIVSLFISTYVVTIVIQTRGSKMAVSQQSANSDKEIRRTSAPEERNALRLPTLSELRRASEFLSPKTPRRSTGYEASSISKRRNSKPTPTTFVSILFVFCTTLWALFTTLPYRIGYIMASMRVMNTDNFGNMLLLFQLFCLVSLNPVGNPLIVIITQRAYKQQVNAMLRKLMRKRDCSVRASNGRTMSVARSPRVSQRHLAIAACESVL